MARINDEMADFLDDFGEDPRQDISQSRSKKVIPASAHPQGHTPAASTGKVAEFKEFGNGSGALLFGKAAETVAGALQLEQHTSSNGHPYVKLTAEQVTAAVPILKEQGWEVHQKNAEVTLHGKTASIRGEAAVAVVQEFGFDLGATSKGAAKVKFDQSKLDEVIGFLKDQKFVVDVQQAEPNEKQKKPVVVFRESLENDNYRVFGASAENLAKALGRKPEQTPGGRAVMEVTSQERKQIVRDMGDRLDISVKPMPEAKLTFYATGGGSVIGSAATEVGAVLGIEPESVTRKADGATFPRVKLKENQVEAAKAAMEGLFTVKTEELEPLAIIKIDAEKREIVVVGAAAPFAAAARGVDLSLGRNDTPYVRLREADLEFTQSVLKEAGFHQFDISEAKPLHKSNQVIATRPQKQSVEPEL